MQAKRFTTFSVRSLCLLVLLFTVVADSLLAQGPESATSSKQPEPTAQGEDEKEVSSLKALKGKIERWGKEHIWLVFIFSLIAILLASFRKAIEKIVAQKLVPFVTKPITWLLIHLGAYAFMLNRYRRTLQRKFRAGGLTQQLIGEGVDLERNYIPIQVSKSEYKHPETIPSVDPTDVPQREGGIRPEAEMSGRERAEVDEVLADEKNYGTHIAIIGDPGSGKTTLLTYLAYRCAKGEGVKPIPALITLTNYVQSGAQTIRSYLDVTFEDNAFPKAKDYLERQLRAGKLLVLLDGFDEVEIEKRQQIRQQIEDFTSRDDYIRNKFIVTSRPIRDAVSGGFRNLEVMPLLPEQRRAFLESKIDNSLESDFNAQKCADLVEAIESHDRIRKLASNPLLLTFLYHVYKYNLELPRRRVELYRQSVNLMLDWDIKTGRPTHIKVKDRDAKKEVLKKVAYHYHANQKSELAEEDLIKQVEMHLPDSLRGSYNTAKELIGEIENSSGILRHKTAERYQFIHATFREYLAVDYISDNRDGEVPKLMVNLCNPWWREVALLLAGIMGNATSLVSRILEYRKGISGESEQLAYVFIAFICLYEAEVDDDVRNQVFKALSSLSYSQAADVIEGTFGSLQEMTIELKTLLVNILSSSDEAVRGWGVGFLSQYISKVPYDQAADVIESIFGSLEGMSVELETFVLNLLNSQERAVHDWTIGFLDQFQRRITITGQDGAPMVFIPAGEFQMGDVDDERPASSVYLDTYCIDKYEVTNAQYARFLNEYGKNTDADGHELLNIHSDYYLIEEVGDTYRPKAGYENHPVIEVSWYGAAAYAQFYGKRLPTETEWEKAARGGLEGRRYPWGDDVDPDKANYDHDGSRGFAVKDMLRYLKPVGSFPPNGYGLYDMVGNVWEWCADWYGSEYYADPPRRNPTGPSSGQYRVLRGGSWRSATFFLRAANRGRYNPAVTDDLNGFRGVVVQD